jgi:hypothetical protein
MLNPQAIISTPGPAPFYDRTGMSEGEAKKLFEKKSVPELMEMFEMSRSSVYFWRAKWGLSDRTNPADLSTEALKDRARARRKKNSAELEIAKADHEELVRLRAENAVLQRLLRDLHLELAKLTKGRKS